jgi:hypothetical protein
MKRGLLTSKQITRLKWLFFVAYFFLSPAIFAQESSPKLGTSKVVGKIDGIQIEAKVQSPSGQQTPLQIVCLFEYTEGDLFMPPALPKELNGMVHVDEALHGLITSIRKDGKFSGTRYETLLIDPPPKSIPAKKLLLVGLGNRHDFNADIMETVGRIGMREALRIGVTSYSHASDIKDAGISSPTGAVAAFVVKGALDAYRTQIYLRQKGAARFVPMGKFTLLTGPAFFEDSHKAVLSTLQTFNKQ